MLTTGDAAMQKKKYKQHSVEPLSGYLNLLDENSKVLINELVLTFLSGKVSILKRLNENCQKLVPNGRSTVSFHVDPCEVTLFESSFDIVHAFIFRLCLKSKNVNEFQEYAQKYQKLARRFLRTDLPISSRNCQIFLVFFSFLFIQLTYTERWKFPNKTWTISR